MTVRRAGALVLVAATTAALTGCAGMLGATMTYNDVETAKITAIVVDNEGGSDVSISTVSGTQTSIQRVFHSTSNPGETYAISGSTLTIHTGCGVNCSVDYQIKAPAGVTVSGSMTSGDVRLTAVGKTDLQLSSGDVTIQDSTGPVQLTTISGDVRLVNPGDQVNVRISSGDLHATGIAHPATFHSISGDIRVVLSAPTSVTAEATSGDIEVQAPQSQYRIAVSAVSGDTSVHGLVNAPSSKNVIQAGAQDGDVVVTAAD